MIQKCERSDRAAKYGSNNPMGARLMSGHTDLHEKLQNQLAEFVNKEAAYVLNLGTKVYYQLLILW